MSNYARRARYAQDKNRLDQHTSKQIGAFMFGGFPEAQRDEEGAITNYEELIQASRDLMKSCIIQGKNHAQVIVYLSSMRDIYLSPTALNLVNIYMGTSISVGGTGRDQGTQILKGQLPNEIETLVSEL